MKWLWVWLIPLLFLLCGCRSEPAVGEQVIVTGMGIDKQDGVWTLAIQAVEALKTAGSLSEQNESATAVYTADGASVAEALQAFLNETGKRTYILQNQIFVLSERLCRQQSVFDVLDYFMRNQEGRALVDVVVSHDAPAALLDITTGSDAIPAEYLSQLLDEGRRYARAAEAHLLDIERASSGMYDLLLPRIAVTNGVPQLEGTAVLRNGVLCDILTQQETTGMLLAGGDSDRCLYTIDDITFLVSDMHRRLTVESVGGTWRYRIALTGVARVMEQQPTMEGSTIQPEKALQHVEIAIATTAETALRRTATQDHSDPFGLSRRTATLFRHRGVTQAMVYEQLPHSRIHVTTQLSLRH